MGGYDCERHLIKPTLYNNDTYVALFASEPDLYLYHPGQLHKYGEVVFEFCAPDAETADRTAVVYTNIYDIRKDLEF